MCNETLLTSVLSELEEHYSGQVLNGKILENTWRNGLAKLSDQQLQIAVARCFQKHPRKYNYFPCVDDILELARGSMPTENAQAYQTADLSKPALPASYEGGISPEEAEANKKEILISRLFLASKSSLSKEEINGFFPKMREFSFHELEQMLLVAKSPVISKSKFSSAHSSAISMFESLATQASNIILEDMRKYLQSGVENYRQKAIDWATNNGYQLVKKGGQVVDIREVEF
jgi:hypothetical protein